MKLFVNVLSLSLLLLVGQSSCRDQTEDTPQPNCVAPALAKNIVGSWSLTSETAGQQAVPLTFNANGTLQDDSNFFQFNFDGATLTRKTYKINQVAKVDYLTVTSTDGVTTISEKLTVKTNTCHQVTLDYPSFGTLNLNR